MCSLVLITVLYYCCPPTTLLSLYAVISGQRYIRHVPKMVLWFYGMMCLSFSLSPSILLSHPPPPPSPSRYCRDIFERNYKTTIGVDFEVEKYKILGVPFHMQM